MDNLKSNIHNAIQKLDKAHKMLVGSEGMVDLLLSNACFFIGTCKKDEESNYTGRVIITFASPFMCGLFGYEQGELRGHEMDDLIPSYTGLRERHEEHVKNWLKTEKTIIMGESDRKIEGLKKNGKVFEILTSLKSLGDGRVFAQVMAKRTSGLDA